MATAFEGPRRKLERARLHIESFCFHERRFFQSGAYTVVGERHANTNNHFFKLAVKEPLPAEAFAAIIGDAIHNLRAALDQLAWKLAEDYSGPKPEDKSTQFPAFLTDAGFDRGRGQLHTRRMGPNARLRMRELQPFHSVGREESHSLWLITDLDNRDKHRNLNVAAATMRGSTAKLFHRPEDRGTYSFVLNQADLTDGDPIGELIIDPPDAQIDVEAVFDFGVVLTAPSVPYVKPRVFGNRFLHRSASWVEAVLNSFEPFYVSGTYDDNAPLPPVASYDWAPPPPDDATPWWETIPKIDHATFAQTQIDRIEKELGEPDDPEDALRHALAGFLVGMDAGYERATNEVLSILERISFRPTPEPLSSDGIVTA